PEIGAVLLERRGDRGLQVLARVSVPAHLVDEPADRRRSRQGVAERAQRDPRHAASAADLPGEPARSSRRRDPIAEAAARPRIRKSVIHGRNRRRPGGRTSTRGCGEPRSRVERSAPRASPSAPATLPGIGPAIPGRSTMLRSFQRLARAHATSLLGLAVACAASRIEQRPAPAAEAPLIPVTEASVAEAPVADDSVAATSLVAAPVAQQTDPEQPPARPVDPLERVLVAAREELGKRGGRR